MAKLISTNPANNYDILGEVNVSSPQEIKRKVAQANQAALAWKELGVDKRIALLKPVCDALKKKSDELALLISKEVGKPITESRKEVKSGIAKFEWFMGNVAF